jgi:hypothetical protein
MVLQQRKAFRFLLIAMLLVVAFGLLGDAAAAADMRPNGIGWCRSC